MLILAAAKNDKSGMQWLTAQCITNAQLHDYKQSTETERHICSVT